MTRNSSKLIVGIGNPGAKYESVRHNIGRRIARVFAGADSAEINSCGAGCFVAVSDVFMNESGARVKQFSRMLGVKPNGILIIHDDADITFGKIKLSFGSRSAGHKGVESVLRALGTKDFWRLRIGIQPCPRRQAAAAERRVRAEELVLRPFSPEETVKLPDIIEAALGAIRAWIEEPNNNR